MERSDEAKRPKLADVPGEADHISDLPDDVLTSILVKLNDAAAACRTSVLARRWRLLWAHLPELHFLHDTDPHRIRSALDAYRGPTLQHLSVVAQGASPESVAVWLPTAVPLVSGSLHFYNLRREDEAEGEGEGDLALPCFASATEIMMSLEVLRVALPPTGVFARLTHLYLFDVRLRGPPCGLGDAVSSPRSPCLQFLSAVDVGVLDDLTIHSESLQEMELERLPELQHFIVKAPALRYLRVHDCLTNALTSTQLVADISAPWLVTLSWADLCNPRSVQLGEMAHLRALSTPSFKAYGQEYSSARNRGLVSLLRRFVRLKSLTMNLTYPPNIGTYRFLMEGMERLPGITLLVLRVTTCEHSFGASLFHVLRRCPAITVLQLIFDAKPEWQEETVCPSDCICGELQKWKTEELVLHGLEEVEIFYLEGTEHDVAVVERLFCWGKELEKMAINFLDSVTENRAEELRVLFQSFCRPGICVNFGTYSRL